MTGFLLDENLPRCLRFRPSFPVFHATDIAKACPDDRIWEYAREHGLAIVSKDADFSERIFLASPPPWIVHLLIGNLPRNDYHLFLQRVWPQVEAMLPANKLVSIYRDRIEALAS